MRWPGPSLAAHPTRGAVLSHLRRASRYVEPRCTARPSSCSASCSASAASSPSPARAMTSPPRRPEDLPDFLQLGCFPALPPCLERAHCRPSHAHPPSLGHLCQAHPPLQEGPSHARPPLQGGPSHASVECCNAVTLILQRYSVTAFNGQNPALQRSTSTDSVTAFNGQSTALQRSTGSPQCPLPNTPYYCAPLCATVYHSVRHSTACYFSQHCVALLSST